MPPTQATSLSNAAGYIQRARAGDRAHVDVRDAGSVEVLLVETVHCSAAPAVRDDVRPERDRGRFRGLKIVRVFVVGFDQVDRAVRARRRNHLDVEISLANAPPMFGAG